MEDCGIGSVADRTSGSGVARGERVRRGVVVAAAALLLCGVLAAAAWAAGPLDFIEPNSSPELAGDAPAGLAFADLDGDTDQDLAVANGFSHDVTILRNSGSGNFKQPNSSPEIAGAAPTSVVAADLDGDTDQDLAVTDSDSLTGNVRILKNNGSGNFSEPGSSPETAGNSPEQAVAADFDDDGDQDLAVANASSGNVTILKNNGSGNFFEPSSSPVATGMFPIAIATADLDGDGDPDLATSNSGPDNVTILRNDGAANFAERPSSPELVGQDPISIAAADLDGDTDQDLAVVNLSSFNMTILRNLGTGNFTEAGSSPEAAGPSPLAVAAADIDGDTDQDLAVANNVANSVAILRNNGAANFEQAPTSPEAADQAPSAVAFADLDGDSDQDLGAANVNSDNVTILRNR